MDELEFRKRLYANPNTPDQELLDAAQNNPDYQKILDETQELEADVNQLLSSVTAPQGLRDQLLNIPTQAEPEAATTVFPNRAAANSSYFQYYAIAATLLLAVGVTFSLMFNSGPSSAEIAFGNEVIQHLYVDEVEINAITAGTDSSILAMPVINQAMADSGTRLVNVDFLQGIPVRMAKPCPVLPAYQSAHLVIQGSQGAVSIIVVNNSPVSLEYTIRDDRFEGVVVPMGEGNMILLGESDENLDQYKDLFSEGVDWVI